jgi:hypothetical protein
MLLSKAKSLLSSKKPGKTQRYRPFGLYPPRFIALQRLNGYNTAEFSRDMSQNGGDL